MEFYINVFSISFACYVFGKMSLKQS